MTCPHVGIERLPKRLQDAAKRPEQCGDDHGTVTVEIKCHTKHGTFGVCRENAVHCAICFASITEQTQNHLITN